jgi:hypothetical protein
MIDFPKPDDNEPFDAFFFLPGENKNTVHLEGATYKEPGEKIGGSAMGDSYHVILFKEASNGELVDIDRFNAVFIDPVIYMSNLIEIGWFGIVTRMTTTSEKFINSTFAKLTES